MHSLTNRLVCTAKSAQIAAGCAYAGAEIPPQFRDIDKTEGARVVLFDRAELRLMSLAYL